MIGRISDDSIKLQKSIITGNINSTFASLKFEQEYRNTSSSPINCNFDLDNLNNNTNTYVIYDIKINRNNNIVEFKIRCNNGSTNSNGHYYDSLNIGQIKPYSTFTITVECSFMAIFISEKLIQFNFPFKETYANAKVECSISVIEKQQIKEISNSNNFIFIPNGKSGGEIKTKCPFECQKQISLAIETRGKVENESICLKIGGDMFIGVSACPSISQQKSNSEIVVQLDISGSMSHIYQDLKVDKITIAKETLNQMIRRLPVGSYFNIIFFNEKKVKFLIQQ